MKNYKLIIGEILTSNLIYSFISPFYNKNIFNFKGYKVDLSKSQNFLKASVFWGLYERSELKMIDSRINNKFPIIELGASLGLTSLALQSKVKDQKIISVEANTKLIENLKQTKHLNNLTNWSILNYAIDYSDQDFIHFEIDPGNLGSKKSSVSDANTIEIKTTTLKKVYEENLAGEDFILVSDIEGAEIEIILEDSELLKKKCRQIIIELHEANYNSIEYSKQAIADLILKKSNMKMIYNDGKTWVFER